MSRSDGQGPAPPAGYDQSHAQDAEESIYEKIREFVRSLGLSASDGLINHAREKPHEDLKDFLGPRDHECSSDCTADSHGTLTPALSIHSSPERLQPLIPPSNFGVVVPGCIYRSAYPEEKNYGFIKDIGIKTILTLVPEPLTPEFQNFMKDAGIQHFHAHIRANKGEVRVESCEMARALRLIMDRSNHPILVHCNKGKHRTGCTIACFRRILGLDADVIREEYHAYAGIKARFLDEVFFENFDINLVTWVARQEGWTTAPSCTCVYKNIPPPLSLVTTA